ncbi:MAG: phosphocholine-specific phospholipase C [Daejeonella sp.]
MENRRDFLRKAALLSGTAAAINVLPPVIQQAMAITPEPGSTFYDAEHIVFVMQENRSFDHGLGTLQGVRGFNDPRAINLPDKNKVFLQTNKDNETYAPFRVDVKDTKVAWMGSVPHGWADQTDARNDGKYDKWLDVKRPGRKEYAHMPLTMGYCTRQDFPFYHSLADAFTVCDQNFCASITGTHPNRHYWMSGTVREKPDPSSPANLWNLASSGNPYLTWKTFPERLSENGVSWKIYQNELSMPSPLSGEASGWLGNFGTNVLEFYKQYNVRLHPGAIAALAAKKENIIKQIDTLSKLSAGQENDTKLAAARKVLSLIEADQQKFTIENYNKLSQREKDLISSAFSTNDGDPDYHNLAPLKYTENGVERELNIPKGDVLHQFRQDVKNGKLPTVSYLHSPGNLSDHPGMPWFGEIYVSEIMNILIENPEVWKKTIFILTYDENDGYFDHVPPFVVPNPYKEDTGKVSASIDAKLDFSTKEQQTNPSSRADRLRDAPIGLGYRVPMLIASPWTRGGFVCSEVFDHTSSIQFLEHFIEKKFNKQVREENITNWRRAVCGDLTSAFRPYNNEPISKPAFLAKEPFFESIHSAKFKQEPANFKKLTADEIAQINKDPFSSPYFPKQERGVRPACALPYELYANARFNKANNTIGIQLKAGNEVFGERSSGSAFYVYSINPYKNDVLKTWNYSAVAGDTLNDNWGLQHFQDGDYHLKAYGPNGFYREFKGGQGNPLLTVDLLYERGRVNKNTLSGNVMLSVKNTDSKPHSILVKDNSYKGASQTRTIAPGATANVNINLSKSFGWYDHSIKVKGYDLFEERFAGRVETGAVGKTDPLMGRVV